MNGPSKLPIEPLSDKRWEAIERGVLDRLDSPAERTEPAHLRLRTPTRVVGALALAAAAWLAFALRPSDAPLPLASTRVATDLASVETSLGEIGVTLAASSELTAIGSDAEGWLVVLEHGSATFEVPPRHERPALVVQAGGTRVEVIGTRFTVTRADEVSVTVDHGRVRVIDGANESFVGAGERWPTEVAPAPREEIAPPEPSVEPVSSASAGARERFERAASLEVGRPNQALALYEALESDGGPWGANALFARGRLALDLGRRVEADAALERYLERYPAGPNAEDARALLSGPR